MNGVWMTVAAGVLSFIGAILGTLIAERHRQKNRLRLAAVDKRLEVYQEAFRLVVELGHKIHTLRKLEKSDSEENMVQIMRTNALEWLRGHYLYLGEEVGEELRKAFRSDGDDEQFNVAFRAIQRAVGLPNLNDDWWA